MDELKRITNFSLEKKAVMEQELYYKIIDLLKSKNIVGLHFNEGGQGGVPVIVYLNAKKIGTYYNSGEYSSYGTSEEADLANEIMEWEGYTDAVMRYVISTDSSYEPVLADRYECEFYLDGLDDNELGMDVRGFGDWGEGEFQTSGCFSILLETSNDVS